MAPFVPGTENLKNIRKNSLVEEGNIKISFDKDSNSEEHTMKIKEIEPNKNNNGASLYESGKQLISFRTHRDIEYISVNSIGRDILKNAYSIAQSQSNEGVKSDDIKRWFVNRYMWSAHKDVLSKSQIENFELAKKCFSLLDDKISFYKVVPSTNDIKINTEDGEIYYEYLSSGHKSVLHILLGLIKEIEYRFYYENIIAKDFDGVILIDEIDLHLHPQWQAKIIKCMKQLFPKSQIIVTTHSPHIIQCAESNEVIPLSKDKDGSLVVNKVFDMKYGFQGWSVEEILQDVMGLETLQSDLYDNIMKDFEKAIDNDDYIQAKKNYEILEQMLHPQNTMLKLLRIQMAGMRN